MLEALFSFHGRINRLRYFLSCLGLGVAIAAPFVLIFGLMGHGGGGALIVMGLLALPALVAFLWSSLSLQARRIRDIGWEPLYVIPGLFSVGIFDFLLAHVVPALSIGPAHHQTFIGLFVNICMGGVLLFWPGKSDDGPAAVSRASRQAPRPPSPSMPPISARTVASVASPAPAGAGFGRRGV